MAITTYTELKTAVENWLNFTAVTARIPEFIALAEAQMNRRLRVRQMVVRSETTLSEEFTEAPDDMIEPMQLMLEISETDVRVLTYMAPERLLAKKASMGAITASEPVFYTHVGGNIQLLPHPGQSYSVELTYYGKIPPLSENATNWLLNEFPDAYLYGALVQGSPYLIEDERNVSAWGGLFEHALRDINKANRVPGGRLRTDLAMLQGNGGYRDISGGWV